jgi:hypothetical protein
LSTVTSADQILVLHAGKVAEAGSHLELLAMKGRYANMWRKQIRAERAAEAASQMVAKANALHKAAMERPGSSGNEGGLSEDVSENEGDSRTLALSQELRHPDSIAGSAGYIASPPGESQVDDTLEDSGADEGNGNETADPIERPEESISDAENSDPSGGGMPNRT